LPVRLDPVPPARKPKKNASAELWQAYRQQKKQRTLPRSGVQAMASARQSLDERADTRPRQLIVIKPLGYRLRKGSKLLYRQPAFLICTDLDLDLQTLVKSYLYRWEIECNHRHEKSLLGVAQGHLY
jgi:hypothetical protein